MGIKKIEALILSSDVQAVEEALEALGIDSVSTTPSVRHRQGSTLYYRGAAYESNWQGFKLECLLTDQLVPSAVDTNHKTRQSLRTR
jgi:nitrogen regulatory protein PII